MEFVYALFIRTYVLFVTIVALFNPKAKEWIEGRKKQKQGYASLKNRFSSTRNYWFHCASLGEFEQALPLIEACKSKDQDLKIIISFFSPSGYRVRKNYPGADAVLYLPADTKNNVREFISILNPEKIFFIKYEFWHFYIQEAKRKNIPVYLVSATFRKEQFFFKWHGGFFRNILKKYTLIFVQNARSKTLLEGYGISSIISGDTRYDRVAGNSLKAVKFPVIEAFKGDSRVLVVGSSWQDEENLVLKFMDQNPGYMKVIIAPHEITRSEEILKNTAQYKIKAIAYSGADEENVSFASVLVIDNIGMLSSLYACADIAFIGGGFSGALHNILEAAVFGVPVLFGDKTQKFPEADALEKEGGGVSVSDYESFSAVVKKLFQDDKILRSMGENAGKFVLKNTGATKMILNEIGLVVPKHLEH